MRKNVHQVTKGNKAELIKTDLINNKDSITKDKEHLSSL